MYLRVKRKKEQRWIAAALFGSGTALILMWMITVILTNLILDERIGEGSGNLILVVFQVIAAFVGSEFAKKVSGRKHIVIPMIVIGLCVIIWIITGLLYRSGYQMFYIDACSILAGGLISCALCFSKSTGNRKTWKGIW